MDRMINKALELVVKAHSGQVDKAGEPYVQHVCAVAEKFTNEKLKIIALLHDVIEDTDVTEEELRKEFPDEIVNAIVVLTKRKGEDYFDYLRRVKENPLACEVKLADLEHNSDLTRLKGITFKDMERRNKYLKAIDYLLSNK